MKFYSLALIFTTVLVGQACSHHATPNTRQQHLQQHTPHTSQNTPQSASQDGSQQSASTAALESECVILLHGLVRTSKSMAPLGTQLQALNYRVINVDYPSRHFPIATLAEKAIAPALDECRQHQLTHIHFVTHSLGGILVRQYLSQHTIPELTRVVMLAPPNKGSEIVDKLQHVPLFGWLNGPAGKELGTDANSLPNTLGKIDFELGVIAGTTSLNLLLSLYLPNPDDGKVSVESTKIDGMRDFISLPVSHPYIMKDEETITQIIHFLQQGNFLHAATPDIQ